MWKILDSKSGINSQPYSGEACVKARVAMGKFYKDKQSAIADWTRLSNLGGLLFYLVECAPNPDT